MPAAPAVHAPPPHLWRWDEPAAARRAGRRPRARSAAAASAARSRWPTRAWAASPYATPTLWAAIQYLMPGEDAPEHRHTQHAFRFVVEGEGVWTVVGRRPGRRCAAATSCRRPAGTGTPTTTPTEHADGVDRRPRHPVPVRHRGAVLRVRPRRDQRRRAHHPERSRSERLWGHPGLRPRLAARARPGTPLLAYRWEHTDRALADQLALEARGLSAAPSSPATRAVRFTNPTNGGDVLPTIRTEIHRVVRGAETAPRRETGSSVYQVFDGSGTVTVGDRRWTVTRGDLFVVPVLAAVLRRAPRPASTDSDSGALDLFRFSDAPIFEALQPRPHAVGGTTR